MNGLLPRKTNLRILALRPALFVRIYWPALLVLLIGTTGDLFTTYENMRLYGPDVEVHIVQKWCSMILGPQIGVPLAKLGQLTFVILVAAWWRPWCPWLLALCGVLYGLAACSNHFLWL